MPKNIKLKISDYHYNCSDGCCTHYGTITTINDVELPCHNQDAETIVVQILEHLGYKVTIERDED